ncbi:MAG TPA: ABC transporter ATP-binding protein [Quisquiliibacterium sp.]|jgi:branched-chain amino acid transport system ATP-binding protein|nr:ABC transporter ATP-binding protein [Quisquiliibacterium sp.]
MLELHALRAGYGAVEVLHEVSLRVDAGEIVSLIGPNTAGKSTLLRAISRLGAAWTRGDIVLDDRSLMSSQAHEIAGRGIAHVLEGRHIFPRMTVAENLRLGAWSRRGTQTEADRAARMDRVIALFPRLGERLSQAAGTLSGGEQQMVAVGRALMLEPRLLLLDEPSHGLAPKVVDEMHAALLEINRQGVSILLVEQNAQLALAVSSRAYVLSGGRVELEGPSAQLVQDDHVRSAYLGI